MDSKKSSKRVILFFTGFGKFGKVLENPTTHLSRAIKDLLAQSPIEDLILLENYIITVSIEDCDEALKEIYSKINQLIDEEEKSADGVENHYVVLHMGVY
jgi:hypothetical protein